MQYIHELPDWPNFYWDQYAISEKLGSVRFKQGQLIGRMGELGFPLQEDAHLNTLTQDVLKSSEIEGEILDREEVRSSVARHLGIEINSSVTAGRNVDGIVEVVLDATQNYDQPLSSERLFAWHASLFSTGYSGLSKISVAAWRTGPMQVVSGPIGKERVHYEAPSAGKVPYEIDRYISWFNSSDATDPVLRGAIAHFWFVTLHPFEDGNGRIARALSDMMLARSEASRQRFYSMSTQIRQERKDYYNILETAQKESLDITRVLAWFLECLSRAIDNVDIILEAVLIKADFWKKHHDTALNDRQRLVINRLLDGFEGKLTSTKWARLAKCSQDTAFRDIMDMVSRGILQKEAAGGRSTSYTLIL